MHFKICNSHFYRKNPSRKFRFKPDGFLCWEFVLKTSILNNSDFQWENLSCKVHNSSTTRIFGAKVRVAKCKLWKIYRYPIWANSLHLFLQFSFHLQVAVKLTISVQTINKKEDAKFLFYFVFWNCTLTLAIVKVPFWVDLLRAWKHMVNISIRTTNRSVKKCNYVLTLTCLL